MLVRDEEIVVPDAFDLEDRSKEIAAGRSDADPLDSDNEIDMTLKRPKGMSQ